MLAFERELDEHPAQVVLVVDDMTATMSCAIVAKKRGLKVAHVIAGTRSFDMNMPREVNRTIVDAISDYLFTAGMSSPNDFTARSTYGCMGATMGMSPAFSATVCISEPSTAFFSSRSWRFRVSRR